MMQQASAISGIPVPGSNVNAAKPMLERRAGRSQAGMFTESSFNILKKLYMNGDSTTGLSRTGLSKTGILKTGL